MEVIVNGNKKKKKDGAFLITLPLQSLLNMFV